MDCNVLLKLIFWVAGQPTILALGADLASIPFVDIQWNEPLFSTLEWWEGGISHVQRGTCWLCLRTKKNLHRPGQIY